MTRCQSWRDKHDSKDALVNTGPVKDGASVTHVS